MTDKEKLEALLRMTDEEADDFIETLSARLTRDCQRGIADVIDTVINDAVTSTLKEVERLALERGGN